MVFGMVYLLPNAGYLSSTLNEQNELVDWEISAIRWQKDIRCKQKRRLPAYIRRMIRVLEIRRL